MRIVLINRCFSLDRGGGERYAHTLAHELARRGCDLHLIAQHAPDPPPNAKLSLVRLPRVGAMRRLNRFAAQSSDLLKTIPHELSIGLTQVRPVDLYFLGGGLNSHWLESRYRTRAARLFKTLANPVNLAHQRFEQKLFADVRHGRTHIYTNSRMCLEQAADRHHPPADHIHVIYHGVDHDRFNPRARDAHRQAARAKLNLKPEHIVILLASHNWARKGLAQLLHAAAAVMPHAHRNRTPLHIVALGRSAPAPFRRLARRLNLHAHTTFLPPVRDVVPMLAAADVFALPTHYDPFAAATLEAMAVGLPVITTDANGAAEAITHGQSGFIVPAPSSTAASTSAHHRPSMPHAHTIDALAHALTQLLDHNARSRMANAAAQAAQPFTWARHFDMLDHLLARIAAPR